uniref:protein-serine/threonine phosphatase n=1 Tax=Oryza nivara TaxID=4536 RepID=A0A0E0I711_ORYNI
MDISQATKEPLPSYGQHQLLGRDCNLSSLPSIAAPHRQAASTSSAEATKERIAYHKNEADPRKRRPRQTPRYESFRTEKDHPRSSMHRNFSEVTPPRRTRRVMSSPLVRNWKRFVGNMKERHDDVSKKVNGAHGRRRRRTGQRHGKAFASVFTSHTQAPHIDDHRIVHDVSQAVIPRCNQTRQRIHIHTSRAGGSPAASNPAGARLDSAQPPSSPEPSQAMQRRHTQPPPTPRPLPISSFPAAQLLPHFHMLPLTSTRHQPRFSVQDFCGALDLTTGLQKMGRSKLSTNKVTHGFHLLEGRSGHDMEDYHVAEYKYANNHEFGLFAIYDGHLGDKVPSYLKANLFNNILKEPLFWTNPQEAIKNAYSSTNKYILENSKQLGPGGSTAVTAIVVEPKKTIDSRRCVGTSPKRRPQGGHDM